MEGNSKVRHWLVMASLILAGNTVYMLPYMRQTYQTTMVEVLGVSNTELGVLNAAYGFVALLCYVPGGWMADRFPARRLLTFSLLCTGAGGLYLLSFPGVVGLLFVHGFWGVVAILTFWAALIKATRAWGGHDEQGRAFGILEGGRGLVGASLASIGLAAFAAYDEPGEGLRAAILLYSVAAIVGGVTTWLLVPDDEDQEEGEAGADHDPSERHPPDKGALRSLLKMKVVWLQALVVLTAYAGFIGTFELGAYTENGYGETKVFGGVVSTLRLWMRPIAAVGAGLLADRFRASKVVATAFVLLVFGYTLLALVGPGPDRIWLLLIETVVIACSVFALRGIYFALLEEGGVPLHLTGTAVGLVSLIGFLPDIVSPILAGWLVDTLPGAVGYRYYFGLMAAAGLVGLAATLGIRRLGAGRP